MNATEPVHGVSAVVDYIGRVIRGNKTLAGLRVRGEVSNLSESSGRRYFALKEGNDVLACVAWSKDAATFPKFKNGDAIVCGGDFTVYGNRSQVQLQVKSVELTGIGMLYAQFEALKERFRAEGLFEESRKRPFPAFLRRIAVVSARNARGVTDFLQTIARRAPFIEVRFIETRVQGDGAEIEIAEAIDKASRLDVDAIVVTRGGGSYEDLFPFNREPVVRAIVRAKYPVMSAVGHAQDVHVSDWVADLACETPSNAAQHFGEMADRWHGRVQRAAAELERRIGSLRMLRAQRLDTALAALRRASIGSVDRRRILLHRLEGRLDQRSPLRGLATRRARLTAASTKLLPALRRGVEGMRHRTGLLQTRLRALDPDEPLRRGYARVTVAGRILQDPKAAPPGTLVDIAVERGALRARVEGVSRDD